MRTLASCLFHRLPRSAGWILLLSLVAWPATLGAAEQPRLVFGPEEFVTTTDSTETFNRSFTVPASTTAPFTLCLVNGELEENEIRSERCPVRELRRPDTDDEDEGDEEHTRHGKKEKPKDHEAVTSGRVLVDGREVVSARDLSKHEEVIEKALRLTTTGPHRLIVELHGPPGSHLTLAIVGVIRVGKLAQARAGHTATLLSDGTVLLTGGRGKDKEVLSSAEVFDPKSLQSAPLSAELTTPRTEHTATLLPNGEVLHAAGRDRHGPLFSAELFQRDGRFREVAASVQIPRAGHTATLLPNGRVLILGGVDVSRLDLAEGERFEVPDGLLYDPQSGRFTPLPGLLKVPRHHHTATLLPSGMVLVVGGRQEDAILGSAELVDPTTGESTLLDPHLHTARMQHTASLLNDGRVLFAGGKGKQDALDSVEVFDPTAQTFSRLRPNLKEERVNHTATVLPTGEILLAGGREEEDKDPTRDTELYSQPGTDTIPPTVLAITPGNNATGVSTTPLIGIRFSEPINVTTVTGSTLTLTGPSGIVPGLVSPGEEGLLAFLVPTAPLAPGRTYTLSLTANIKDTSGHALTPFTSQFTTVAAPTITSFTPTSGTPGTSVQIGGANFDPVTANNAVKFHGVLASVTAAGATTLTALVPGSATTGPITVTTHGGTVTSAMNFTVITGPTITSFSPISGPVGTAVTINGQNFDAVAANNQVKFNGTPAIVSSAGATQIHTVVPQGATTGPITVTTAQGTGTSAQNFTVTGPDFTISALPTPLPVPAVGQGAFAVSLSGTGGFTNLATLSVTGVPSGMTATFSAATLTMGQSAFLTMTTNGTTPAGTYPLTVNAAGLANGVQTTRSATANVQVGAAGATTLSGQVLDEDAKPVKNALVKLGTLQVSTDDGGNFLLPNPPAGVDQLLFIDGGPASTPGHNFPIIPHKVTIVAGQNNALGFPVYLHFQKTTGLVDISNSSVERVVTDPQIPGFEMKIPAGATITGWDGQPNTQISIRRVPIDRLPLPPMPSDRYSPIVYMDYFGKPGGGTPSEPIPITLPNDLEADAGTQVELWFYDEAPDGSRPNQWAQYGTGTVSADGSQIIPDINPATGKPFGQPRFCCGALRTAVAAVNVPKRPGAHGSGPQDGDPVDLSTGIFMLQKTDMVLPGRFPVTFTRFYRTNSDNTAGPFGFGTSYSYQVQLFVVDGERSLLLPNAARVIFTLQPDGTYRDQNAPAFRGTVLTQTAGGHVLRFKDGTTWSFGPTIQFFASLISQSDRNGNTITLNRTSGVLTEIVDSAGRRITLTYDASGRITQLADPLGRTVAYTYDGSGRLVTVRDPELNETRYSYDAAGRMATLIDGRGITFLTNEYDSASRVSRQTQADGGVWQFAYGMTGSVVTQTTVTDPQGHQTTTRFNGTGYGLGRTDAQGQASLTARDPVSNLVTATTDSLGRKTTYEYDANGNVTKITDPDNKVTQFEYEPTFNRVTKITDALNQVTEFTYDPANGNLLTTKDPLNHVTTITYNAFGQPTSVQGPILSEPPTTFAYDTDGNLITTTDPPGNMTQRAYDAVSRLTSLTDPRGLSTQFHYDGLNRVRIIADPAQGLTRFFYDPNGDLQEVADAKGQTTTYTYDSMDRLATRKDALNRQESYQYDPAGNLTQFTDRKNQQSTFQYDALNRRTQATYADATVTFTYDSVGRLSRATDSLTGTIEFSYDTLDRLSKELSPQGVVTYAYDALGRRTQMTANGQAPVGYQYDAASRLTQVAQGTQIVGMGYDNANRRTSLTYPNGTSTAYTYDNASRLTGIVHNGPAGLIESLTYAYDAAGNRINLTRTSGTATLLPAAVQAAYDAANQQIQFNSGAPNQTFDANGNLTSDGIKTYTWDARNRLVGITGPALAASFSYDALGRRISKTINGVTTSFLYDGNDLVQELGGGAVGASYVRSLNMDEPFVRQGAVNEFYHTDALGSTLELSNAAGATAVSFSYEAFGKTTVTGTSSNPFQYTGRENDGTGLYSYRNRYYSPVLSRFISEDQILAPLSPLSLGLCLKISDTVWLLPGMVQLAASSTPQRLHPYAYVRDNPINFTDPNGLIDKRPCGAAIDQCLKQNMSPALRGCLTTSFSLYFGGQEGISNCKKGIFTRECLSKDQLQMSQNCPSKDLGPWPDACSIGVGRCIDGGPPFIK